MNLNIHYYTPEKKELWDAFISKSKNGSFLFYRDFLEYHKDRFTDASLMIYDEKEVLAVLPANRVEDQIFSHQGLSYGGFVLPLEIKFEEVAQIIQQTLHFLEKEGVTYLDLKLIPEIYHKIPAEEIDYLLFKLEAQLVRRDSSSAIDNRNPLAIKSSNRRRGIARAKKSNLNWKETEDLKTFWGTILKPNLKQTHLAVPVHNLSEITILKSKFPDSIRLFGVYYKDIMVAGTVIFETPTVAHAQYISANTEGRKMGALDFLFSELIKKYEHKNYFNFGISNEQQGQVVNQGLLSWKESFGARTKIQDFYRIETSQHHLLNSIFI